MKGLRIKISILAISILSIGFVHHSSHLCEGFLPENDLKVPAVKFKSRTIATPGLSKETTDKVIAAVYEVYAPVIKDEFGGILEIVNNWKDERVNAFARRAFFSNEYYVEIWGGLARHPEMTVDGLVTVLCHEIGHHVGGAPKNVGFFGRSSWSSVEGQSDYWASMKCAKRVYEKYDNVKILSERFKQFKNATNVIEKRKTNVSKYVVNKCEAVYDNVDDVALCTRAAMGALSTARMLAAARADGSGNDPDFPEFDTPDSSKVDRTFSSHPEAQCRLDTYLAGALCILSYDEKVSQSDSNTGVCNRLKTNRGNQEGVRSRCWYKPGEGASWLMNTIPSSIKEGQVEVYF